MSALDKLGLAIANAGYTWTPEMREAYEKGIKEFEAIRETERKRHAFELSMQEELFADKAEAIRAEALEEAAKFAAKFMEDAEGVSYGIDRAIRGLK